MTNALPPTEPLEKRDPPEDPLQLQDQHQPENRPAPRQLHPLPRGLVELYGFLAVLFVLVPEWMAGSALFGFREAREGSNLPAPSGAWRRLPELKLASMGTTQLRLLARQQRLPGYARLNREQLTTKLLKRLKRLT